MSDLFGGGYTPEPDDDDAYAGTRKLTPEMLRDWILSLGRQPTLKEIKDHFGVVLTAMFCGWELQRRGDFPTFPKKEAP